MLPISEIFLTVQGEGIHAGTPAMFVRLQGCDVGCPWCDTKHSWLAINAKMTAAPAELVRVLVHEYGLLPHHLVVITGGEPCTYDLRELTATLHDKGYKVQIETSGTYPVKCDDRTWVTVSPKIDMPGKRPIVASAIERADEIKFVVGKEEDVDTAIAMSGETHLYLQPVSQSKKATQICVDACIRTGAHLSLQTHKYIGIE